jgi:hypothetical protein
LYEELDNPHQSTLIMVVEKGTHKYARTHTHRRHSSISRLHTKAVFRFHTSALMDFRMSSMFRHIIHTLTLALYTHTHPRSVAYLSIDGLQDVLDVPLSDHLAAALHTGRHNLPNGIIVSAYCQDGVCKNGREIKGYRDRQKCTSKTVMKCDATGNQGKA